MNARYRFTLTVSLPLLLLSLLVHASNNVGSRLKALPLNNAKCFFAVGGGDLAGRGSLPQNRTMTPECIALYQEYFKEDGGQYWTDIEDAMEEGKPLLDMHADYSQMVVTDIDETLLSNIPLYLNTNFTPSQEDRLAWYALGEDPVLPASLDLYKKLRAKGFSIALITGRPENARSVTIKNLAKEGFGTQCTKNPPSSDDVCYFKLIMKPDDDPRTTTVYKSQARGELKMLGFDLVALFGDQWSDLLGIDSADFLIKMPNPLFYTL